MLFVPDFKKASLFHNSVVISMFKKPYVIFNLCGISISNCHYMLSMPLLSTAVIIQVFFSFHLNTVIFSDEFSTFRLSLQI